MQQQVSSLNNLDTLVILKGSQLNLVHKDREHLPAAAGLPSSAGLYRSKSFGGGTLNGVAKDGRLLNNLLKKEVPINKNPVNGLTAIPTAISQPHSSKSTKTGKKYKYSIKSTVFSKLLDSKKGIAANQRRARSLVHFVPCSERKTALDCYKTAANKSFENALENLKINEEAIQSETKYRPTQSAKKLSAADIAKVKAVQEEKMRISSRTTFLECRAQFIKLNSIVQKMEELKWQKKSEGQSVTSRAFSFFSKMYICLHAGAGFHHPKNSKKYYAELNKITNSTRELLLSGASAVQAVSHAISLLEDSPLTNAGISGSNFSIDGGIEVDACIMDQEGWFGSVGAVPMTSNQPEIHPNPIKIAELILNQSKIGPDRAGRQPPLMLVGESAHKFAKRHGLNLISSNQVLELITQEQKERYISHMHILKNSTNPSDSDIHQDTVGAIVIDSLGSMAVGCSSGGISLKWPGRVGEAAIPGSGIFIARNDSDVKVATTLSGTGEQIMKTYLAQKMTEIFLDDSEENYISVLKELIDSQFLSSHLMFRDADKYVGAIVVRQSDDFCEFFWAHTTPSFCISVCDGKKSTVYISRLKDNQKIKIGAKLL